MRIKILSLLFLLCNLDSHAQDLDSIKGSECFPNGNYLFADSFAQDLDFIRGSKCFQNGNYLLADSLFTVSINNYPHVDKLFNRALARINLKDTTNYCLDLKWCYERFNDKEALSLYLNTCVIKVDSILYDKKFQESEDEVRYLEITVHNKYTNEIWGEYQDLKKSHEVNSFSFKTGIQSYTTNVFGNYEYIDNKKVYIKPQTPPLCKIMDMQSFFDSQIQYTKEIIEALNEISNQSITVYVGAIIDYKGHVKDAYLVKKNHTLDQLIIDEAIRVVAQDSFTFKAATFNNEPVFSKIVIPVIFPTYPFAQNKTTIKYYRDIDLQKETIERKANYKIVSTTYEKKSIEELFKISTNKLIWHKSYRNKITFGKCYYSTDQNLKKDSVIYGKFKPQGFYSYDLNNQKLIEKSKGDFAKPKLIGVDESIYSRAIQHNVSDIAVWIAFNIDYPTEAQINAIQGDVRAQFTIDENGKVGHVRIIEGVNKILDIESYRILNSLPRMKPARLNGEAIKLYIETPINFLLQ